MKKKLKKVKLGRLKYPGVDNNSYVNCMCKDIIVRYTSLYSNLYTYNPLISKSICSRMQITDKWYGDYNFCTLTRLTR